jgi:2-keto-3-deoxy-L-rhamnonate aldolase RhmA
VTAHLVTPRVRVPSNEPGIIGTCLDGGAWGIICPMVNNEAEAPHHAVPLWPQGLRRDAMKIDRCGFVC